MEDEEDGVSRVRQVDLEAVDSDTTTLQAQIASLEEQMRVMMSEKDLV